ncbi:MAG: hypothetical protein WBO48_06140, partial [Candidatus Promineifilaceae bacterium]
MDGLAGKLFPLNGHFKENALSTSESAFSMVSFAQIVKSHNNNEGFMPEENSNEVIAVTNLLEITGDDIALLSDTDLRSLIGLLCEADFRSAGLSTKGIVWGGHQDASDGG